MIPPSKSFFFFFNDTATTEIYTLSLHDALPIFTFESSMNLRPSKRTPVPAASFARYGARSEEHTSELQSRLHLVCRLLLEKKKICKAGSKRNRRSTASDAGWDPHGSRDE